MKDKSISRCRAHSFDILCRETLPNLRNFDGCGVRRNVRDFEYVSVPIIGIQRAEVKSILNASLTLVPGPNFNMLTKSHTGTLAADAKRTYLVIAWLLSSCAWSDKQRGIRLLHASGVVLDGYDLAVDVKVDRDFERRSSVNCDPLVDRIVDKFTDASLKIIVADDRMEEPLARCPVDSLREIAFG